MIEESQNIEHKESSFEALVKHIRAVGDVLQQDARLVINRNVTTRAWLTGLYIVEYEQNGSDRAKYGTHLLQDLSKRLGGKELWGVKLKEFPPVLFVFYRTQAGNWRVSERKVSDSPLTEWRICAVGNSTLIEW